MIKISFLFIFVFEQFISYLYLNNKFSKNKSDYTLVLSYVLSFVFQYSISFLNIMYLNLLSFFISNFLIAKICFKTNIKQALANIITLEIMMISTELLVMYLFSTILGVGLFEFKNNETLLIIEASMTKLLYFLVVFIISKISKKEGVKPNIRNDYSILLSILPLSSVIILICFSFLSYNYGTNKPMNLAFTIISFILLLSNVIVFLINEKIISTLNSNAELQLENQKNEINKEYYQELEKQYSSSNILVHDIKHCLSNIKVLSENSDNKKVVEYVDSIYKEYNINSLRKFSNNKLVNVVVSRYANLCSFEKINFSVDIRNIDFSFISDSDITSLLDNLLQNAYEATRNTKQKDISLFIDKRNENYIFIQIKNYTDTKPNIKGDIIVTTKHDNKIHGIGTKSIERIVKKYEGNIKYEYLEDTHLFVSSIIIKSSNKY